MPGLQFCELMPHTARQADKVCVLRAMSSDDNAHSSSGYYMLTGHPHQPQELRERQSRPAQRLAPAWAPSSAGCGGRAAVPAAITLPNRIFNTDGSVWPGQDAGFLGRNADPWLFTFNPVRPDRSASTG